MGIDPSIMDLHYRFAHHCEIRLIKNCSDFFRIVAAIQRSKQNTPEEPEGAASQQKLNQDMHLQPKKQVPKK